MCTLNVIFISDAYKIIYMNIHKSGGNKIFFFYFLSLLPNTIVTSVKLILLDVFCTSASHPIMTSNFFMCQFYINMDGFSYFISGKSSKQWQML